MPVFVAALGGMLINLVGYLAGRVLVGLGIAVITYAGLSTSLNWMKTQALMSFSGMSAEAVQLAAYLKVGVSISIITSAITARLVIDGLSGDTFKRWVLK